MNKRNEIRLMLRHKIEASRKYINILSVCDRKFLCNFFSLKLFIYTYNIDKIHVFHNVFIIKNLKFV